MTTRLGESPGWVGMEYGDEETAVWLLRAVAVGDILVRRERNDVVPVDLRADGERIATTAATVARARLLSGLRNKYADGV